MQVLPQLLYLFRTLPIPIPNSYFKSLQSTLNRYLWQGRKARCAFGKLTKHRKAGGIRPCGHVHLQDYYFASLLAQLQHWFLPHSGTLWAELEQSQIRKGTLRDFPINISLNANSAHLQNSHEWSGPTTPMRIPINAIQTVIPDTNFTTWMARGIHYVEDMMEGTSLMSFQSLRDRYGLPAVEQYKHLQVSHMIRQHTHFFFFIIGHVHWPENPRMASK